MIPLRDTIPSRTTPPAEGGIAFWAHVGGFAVGLAVSLAVRILGAAREPVRRRA